MNRTDKYYVLGDGNEESKNGYKSNQFYIWQIVFSTHMFFGDVTVPLLHQKMESFSYPWM